jgi:hypothetical protein
MPSKTHSTLDSGPSTSPSDDEVLVRVDGVGKKFCRSLKKSLWYGVCDIAGELLPGRKRQRVAGSELRVAREEAEVAGSELLVASGNTSAAGADTRHQLLVTAPKALPDSLPATRHSLPPRRTSTHGMMIYEKESFTRLKMSASNSAGGNAWG